MQCLSMKISPSPKMLFHYVEDGQRVYTLKDKREGKWIVKSHPARFSPQDAYSKYRIITKERYDIFPFEKQAIGGEGTSHH